MIWVQGQPSQLKLHSETLSQKGKKKEMEILFISNNVGYNYKLYIKYNNVGWIVWNSFNRGREKEEVESIIVYSGIMEANNTTMW